MHLRLGPSGAASRGVPRRSRRLCRFVATSALLAALALAVSFAMVGAASAASNVKPTLTKQVDANADGVFNDTENVPKNATYPLTVTFQLTMDAGSFAHKIVAIADSTTSDIGDCASLIGTVVAANTSVSCTYTESLSQAGTSPFVNTATLTFDSGGNDVLSNNATVNFPGMTLVKSSTTTAVTSAGQVIPYGYLITNTGTSELTGIALTDNNTDSTPTCPGSTLDVGASMTCTGQHTVTQTELDGGGNLVNVATASSNEAPDATATVSIPIQQSPAMTLKKSSTTTLITAAGQVVPYSYLISNAGNVTLTGITLTDNKTDSPPTCPTTTLMVGASMTCTAQHTVTSAEFAAGGNIVNVATASSNEAPGATDTLSIPIVAPPPPLLSCNSAPSPPPPPGSGPPPPPPPGSGPPPPGSGPPPPPPPPKPKPKPNQSR